jgi:hypothetical protein
MSNDYSPELDLYYHQDVTEHDVSVTAETWITQVSHRIRFHRYTMLQAVNSRWKLLVYLQPNSTVISFTSPEDDTRNYYIDVT